MIPRRTLAGLLGASLLILGACKTVPSEVTILAPPADLMADCPEPSSSAVTNEDLVNRFIDMRGALRACNADKRALRSWTAEVQKANPD